MRIAVVHSGTSADAIDVALVDVDAEGDDLVLTPREMTDAAWPTRLRERVLSAALGRPVSIGEVARLDIEIAEAFADALEQSECADADLVVSPGQTVFHWVEEGRARGTLQLGRAAVLAERTGRPVVSDLRAADIAAGGQGAPLMPVFDRAWLGAEAAESGEPVATLNLGGIANVSVVEPDGSVSGWDTGPANGLLDAVITRATDGAERCDRDGARAASGRVAPELLDALLRHPHFELEPPKSTGRETFDLDMLDRCVDACGAPPELDDLLATLVRLTARTVADALRDRGVHTVIVSGGGIRNPTLMRALAEELEGCRVTTSAERGVDPDGKESLLFALVGYCGAHGIPLTLDERIGGRVPGTTAPAGWTPGTRGTGLGAVRVRGRDEE